MMQNNSNADLRCHRRGDHPILDGKLLKKRISDVAFQNNNNSSDEDTRDCNRSTIAFASTAGEASCSTIQSKKERNTDASTAVHTSCIDKNNNNKKLKIMLSSSDEAFKYHCDLKLSNDGYNEMINKNNLLSSSDDTKVESQSDFKSQSSCGIESAARMALKNPFISTVEEAMKLVGFTNEEARDKKRQSSVRQAIHRLSAAPKQGFPKQETTQPVTRAMKPDAVALMNVGIISDSIKKNSFNFVGFNQASLTNGNETPSKKNYVHSPDASKYNYTTSSANSSPQQVIPNSAVQQNLAATTFTTEKVSSSKSLPIPIHTSSMSTTARQQSQETPKNEIDSIHKFIDSLNDVTAKPEPLNHSASPSTDLLLQNNHQGELQSLTKSSNGGEAEDDKKNSLSNQNHQPMNDDMDQRIETELTLIDLSPSLLKSNHDVVWNFVKSILDIHQRIQMSRKQSNDIAPIATDAMFFVAKAMFDCRDRFALQDRPTNVSLAYHYTKECHVESIAENGLICSKRGKFGPGVYLCKNAMAFRSRGPVGILVAIVKGVCKEYDSSSRRLQALRRKKIIRQQKTQQLYQQHQPQPQPLHQVPTRKELFLMFTKVLMKYLEAKDLTMHSKAKEVIRDCARKNKDRTPGYEILSNSMQLQLRSTVGNFYWSKAEKYLAQYLCYQYQKNRGLSIIEAQKISNLIAKDAAQELPMKEENRTSGANQEQSSSATMGGSSGAVASSTSASVNPYQSSYRNQVALSQPASAANQLKQYHGSAIVSNLNDALSSLDNRHKEEDDFNTVIGIMNSRHLYNEEIVLQESDQCIPIIRFDTSLVDGTSSEDCIGSEIIWHYHKEIQNVVDDLCNHDFMNKKSSDDNIISKDQIFPQIYPPFRAGLRSTNRMLGITYPYPPLPIQPFLVNPPLPLVPPSSPNLYIFELDALSLLLSIESMSVHKAMILAGFGPREVKDTKLKEKLKNKVKEYQMQNIMKSSGSSSHFQKVAEIIVTSFSTLTSAMTKAGVYIGSTDPRKQILEIIAEYMKNPPYHLCKQIKIYKAAQMMVLDNQSLSTKDALSLMGLPGETNLKLQLNRQRCDLSLSLGIVDVKTKNASKDFQSKSSNVSGAVQNSSIHQVPTTVQFATAKPPPPVGIYTPLPTSNFKDSNNNNDGATVYNVNKITSSNVMNSLPSNAQINSHVQHQVPPAPFPAFHYHNPINTAAQSFPFYQVPLIPNPGMSTLNTANKNNNISANGVNARTKTLLYEAPDTLLHKVHAKITPVTNTLDNNDNNKDSVCAICLCPMQQHELLSTINIHNCSHRFHDSCIMEAIKHNSRCPMCRKNISDEPQGHSPSGSMVINTCESTFCAGFESSSNGTIAISYDLRGGIQKEYHPNPGKSYRSTRRMAYLPDNDDGQALLKRLMYAFRCGLSFQIGTSMTTGRSDCITWSSIHHKSSLSGGVRCHGYPDDKYFTNCNAELDGLGVPKKVE